MPVIPEILDWAYLRGAVVLSAGCAALGVSLVAGSAVFESRMEREHHYHSDRLNEISLRYLALDGEKRMIGEYLPQFLELQSTGLLGKEHRLNWIETLQDAGNTLGLPSLGYEIKAQEPWSASYQTPSGGYGVFVSEMTLGLQLLHEGDLFTLLDLLDERAKGLFTVSSCDLTRNFVELTDNPDAANVTADCLLEWFSVKPADGRETGP